MEQYSQTDLLCRHVFSIVASMFAVCDYYDYVKTCSVICLIHIERGAPDFVKFTFNAMATALATRMKATFTSKRSAFTWYPGFIKLTTLA